jgi:hypothetical protein
VRLASPKAAATLEDAVTRAVDEAVARPERATVEVATSLVTLARELALDVDLDAAQERLHDALRADGGPAEALLPLARRLGVSTHPLDLPW